MIYICNLQEQLIAVHLSGIIDMDYLKKCDAANCKVLVSFWSIRYKVEPGCVNLCERHSKIFKCRTVSYFMSWYLWCYIFRCRMCLWPYSECIYTPGRLKKSAWPQRESNLRPLVCWSNALPTELKVKISHTRTDLTPCWTWAQLAERSTLTNKRSQVRSPPCSGRFFSLPGVDIHSE